MKTLHIHIVLDNEEEHNTLLTKFINKPTFYKWYLPQVIVIVIHFTFQKSMIGSKSLDISQVIIQYTKIPATHKNKLGVIYTKVL